MVEFKVVTDDALVYLADNLREADRIELWASGHDDALQVLRDGVKRSTHCSIACADGVPGAIIGLSPINLISGVAAPWMLGTEAIMDNRRALMSYTPDYIRIMLKAYPHLVNYVHAPNTKAVRWLRHIGFVLHPAEPYGPYGEPFHRFEMKA